MRRILHLAPVALFTLTLACGPEGESLSEEVAAAEADGTFEDAPTGWWWYYGQTASQVTSRVASLGARVADLEVESTSPLRFSVALVRNTGSHASGWWWYYGQTASQVTARLSQHNARITDLEVYFVNGQTRFAVVLEPNTGSNAKAWWWYYGLTSSQLSSYASRRNARIVDIETYTQGGRRRYAVVLIRNSGADASGWWYYYNVTPGQISSYLSTNNARLIDIEPHNSSGTRFSVVMKSCSSSSGGCPMWWYYYGVSSAQVSQLVAQNGARITDIETYTVNGNRRLVNGNRRFAVVMINNSNALTSRIGQILRNATDGSTGAYLKQVNGSVLASLQEDFVFEPASTIKAVIGLHAMQRVDAGADSRDRQFEAGADTVQNDRRAAGGVDVFHRLAGTDPYEGFGLKGLNDRIRG